MDFKVNPATLVPWKLESCKQKCCDILDCMLVLGIFFLYRSTLRKNNQKNWLCFYKLRTFLPSALHFFLKTLLDSWHVKQTNIQEKMVYGMYFVFCSKMD